jgi:hypothetical protein
MGDVVSPQESKALGGISFGVSHHLLIHYTFLYDASKENLDERYRQTRASILLEHLRPRLNEQVLETSIAKLESSATSHRRALSWAGGFADTHFQYQSFHLTNIPVKCGVKFPDMFTIGMSRLVPEH